MINFRSRVLPEAAESMALTPKGEADLSSRIEKVDLEMGDKLALRRSLTPDLGFGALDDDPKRRNTREDTGEWDLFRFPSPLDPREAGSS